MRPPAMTVTAREMRELGPFVPGTNPDPAAALGKIGPLLHRVLMLSMEKERLLRILWKRYLADCKRRGVRPAGSSAGNEIQQETKGGRK